MVTENILIPDSENDPQEEAELTYRLQEAMHEYTSSTGYGPCEEPTRKFCYEHKKIDYHNACGAQESSVLHYSDRHDIECHCYSCSQ